METQTSPLPVRKFRLLAGTHVMGKGKKTYTKGKIVKSDKDLTKLFVGKFVEVGKRDDEEAEEASDKPKKPSTKPAKE